MEEYRCWYNVAVHEDCWNLLNSIPKMKAMYIKNFINYNSSFFFNMNSVVILF